MSNDDLRQRAAELTIAAFNANAKGLWGALRDDCLGAAHKRVQMALADYDPSKGALSTFVRARVPGAIKNELTRQSAGMIGKPRGENYAPVSLDGVNAPRFTSDDPSAARWHPVAGLGDPTDDDPESPLAPIYGAQLVTAPGAAFDGLALTPEAQLAAAGKSADRMQAPAAVRQMWREHARLDWHLALSSALASEHVSPDDKETLRGLSVEPEAADAYAQAVREVRPHYGDDDEAIAEAAVFHLLAVLARLKPLRVESVPVWTAEELREVVRTISDALLEHIHGEARVPRGETQTARAVLRELIAGDPPMSPIMARRLAKDLPGVLEKHARRRAKGGQQPAGGGVALRWLWRCYSP